MESKIEKLYKSNINVFAVEDLASLWEIPDRRRLLESVKHYVNTGRLKSIKRGVYVVDKKYSELEVAQKVYTPSYISIHTALGIYGVNFQKYQAIFSVSLRTKSFVILDREYSYHAVDEKIFWNPIGITNVGNYQIASVERAICDSIYLFPQIGFDNLAMVDNGMLLKIAEIYNSSALKGRIGNLVN